MNVKNEILEIKIYNEYKKLKNVFEFIQSNIKI